MKKIVIATNNVGKLNEIAAILAPLDIEIVAQSTLGVSEAAEPHCTFVENALAKARHASGHTGLPTLADDSGICVDALNGAPGVYSARFAGESAGGGREQQDARNNKKLLDLIICEAEWHGEIVQTPRGSGGFGYDPLFLLPQLKQTGAELRPAEKNRISHRAQALGLLAERLRGDRRETKDDRRTRR